MFHLQVSRSLLYVPIELLSQLGLAVNVVQFKCAKYFRDNLTLVFEDSKCSNPISESSSEMTMQRTTKNLLSRAGFELTSSGF